MVCSLCGLEIISVFFFLNSSLQGGSAYILLVWVIKLINRHVKHWQDIVNQQNILSSDW